MKMFGTQIDYVAKVLNAKLSPADAGGETPIAEKIELAKSFSKVIMTIVVSIFILVFFGWLVADPSSDEQTKTISAGFIGSVVGYWLK